ncbi:MAG: alpha/beta hydrolase-fold protein [Candidatus Eremiobacterota bacterium]
MRAVRRGRDGALYIGLRRGDHDEPETIVIPDEDLPRPGRVTGGTICGDIQAHDFRSEILDESRTILVYRPPGYSDKSPWNYPVLYLFDGQNVFDVRTAAFGVEWRLDETAEALIQARKMEPILMVAVYNSPDRFDEYTPSHDPEHGGGGADRYGAFLIRELKPFIDRIYKTNRKASSTALMGSSLGGLCALYLGWKHPETFGLVAALSPSLWWAGRDLIAAIAGDPRTHGPQKVWLDMGTEESDEDRNRNQVPDVIDDVRTMKAVLLQKGYRLNEDFFYREVQGAYHDERSWSDRVGEILQALYPVEDVNAIRHE